MVTVFLYRRKVIRTTCHFSFSFSQACQSFTVLCCGLAWSSSHPSWDSLACQHMTTPQSRTDDGYNRSPLRLLNGGVPVGVLLCLGPGLFGLDHLRLWPRLCRSFLEMHLCCCLDRHLCAALRLLGFPSLWMMLVLLTFQP